MSDLVSFGPLIYKYQGESEPLHGQSGSPTGRCFSASVVRPSCRQFFSGQLRSALDRSFSDFFDGSSHHARIGSSGHSGTDHFYITILLGPYAFSPCRFFADFCVTCTSCREWEFLHGLRLRFRPGNAPTPCRHHADTMNRPGRVADTGHHAGRVAPRHQAGRDNPDTVTPSNDQRERRTAPERFQGMTPNAEHALHGPQ